MTVPIVAAVSLAACLLALGWAREHRLRRSMLSLLARIFTKEDNR
jgi:hypothetical protein